MHDLRLMVKTRLSLCRSTVVPNLALTILCCFADNVDDMATAVSVLFQALAVSQDGSAAAPATDDAPAQGPDAAALRLEAIHLLLLMLQVPLEQVRLPIRHLNLPSLPSSLSRLAEPSGLARLAMQATHQLHQQASCSHHLPSQANRTGPS